MTFDYLRQTLFFFRSHIIMIATIQLPFLLIISIMGLYTPTSINADSQQQSMLAGLAFANLTLTPIYWGASIAYFGSVVSGTPYSVSQSIAMALSRWRHLLLVYIFTGMAAAFGFMLFIAPGVYILIRLGFADYFCVNAGMSSMKSMKASWKATQAYFWQLMPGLTLLFVTLSGGQLLLNQMLFSPDEGQGILSVIIELIFGLLHSLLIIYAFRIYCVMRQESPELIQEIEQDNQ